VGAHYAINVWTRKVETIFVYERAFAFVKPPSSASTLLLLVVAVYFV
jgi:hypothetical protein